MNRLSRFASIAALLLASLGPNSVQAKEAVFRASLTGADEVPAVETQARGHTMLFLKEDATELKFRVIVSNIENVSTAAIYMGATGANGPAVAMLYGPSSPGGGKKNGVLTEGAITAANLIGPLQGRPLADLISEIRNGNIYVNVQTDDGAGEANTRPGDFPNGEIRGQIR
jgi:hypothetical protein